MSDIAVVRIIFSKSKLAFKLLEERELFFLFFTRGKFEKGIFHQYEFLEGYLKIWWN